MRASAAFLLACALLMPCMSSAAQEHFGTCSYWNTQKSDSKADPQRDIYRIGFAHGVAMGAVSTPYTVAGGTDASGNIPKDLDQVYRVGLYKVLMRPAVLMSALDTKCADYRNDRLYLGAVAFLVTLELAGMDSKRIEDALVVLRRDDADNAGLLRALRYP